MDINNNFARPWGPGTMYEMAIPLALYMGCSKIVTIGWDLFKNTLNLLLSLIQALPVLMLLSIYS